MIKFGNSATDVKYSYGLEPEKFISIHEHLSTKYGLKVSKTHYYVGEFTFRKLGNKKKAATTVLGDIVHFQILCMELEKRGFKIKPLIMEFNEAQKSDDIGEIRHVFSLANLCFEYIKERYDINIVQKKKGMSSPDLMINSLTAELKVRREPDYTYLILKKLGVNELEEGTHTYEIDLREELCLDLGQAISSRFRDASTQADVIFFDFSYRHSLSSIQFHWPSTFQAPTKPIRPQKYRLIVFSTLQEAFDPFKTYFWTYLDFDPLIWELIGYKPK